MATVKTAIRMKTLEGFQGAAALYRVEPMIAGHRWIVVSAVDAMLSGPETYIFPANKRGEVTDWCEMEGSFRGALDHARALRNIGYRIVKGAS